MGDLGVNPAVAAGQNGAASRLPRLNSRVHKTRRPGLMLDARIAKTRHRRANASADVRGQMGRPVGRQVDKPRQLPRLRKQDRLIRVPLRASLLPPFLQVRHPVARVAARRRNRRAACRDVLWRLRCRARVHLAEGLLKGSPLLHRPHRRSRLRLVPVSRETTAMPGILQIGRHAGRRRVSRGRISGDVHTRTIFMRRWISARTIAVF